MPNYGSRCGICNSYTEENEYGGYDCLSCLNDVHKLIANTTVLGHLYMFITSFFNFRIFGAFGFLRWAVERAFSIGDYHPIKGVFHIKGYLTKDTRQ